MQWEFLRLARKYADETDMEPCGGDEICRRVLDRWEATLAALERDPASLDGQLDWVTKHNLLRAYVDRDGLEWDDPKLAALDIQYHDVRPDRSLYERLVRAGKVERLVDEDDSAARHGLPARDDQGVLPRDVPVTLGRLRRRGELGQSGARRGIGPSQKNPNDGTRAW